MCVKLFIEYFVVPPNYSMRLSMIIPTLITLLKFNLAFNFSNLCSKSGGGICRKASEVSYAAQNFSLSKFHDL